MGSPDPEPLAEAIIATGSGAFPSRLMTLAHRWFDADQLVVFRIDLPSAATILIAENITAGAAEAQKLARKYATSHYGSDPNAQFLKASEQGADSILCRAVSAEDISDPVYRDALFNEPGLRGKMALLSRHEGHVFYINLYRGIQRPPFDTAALERLRLLGGVLALIERHAALSAGSQYNPKAMGNIVSAIARERGGQLSDREATVCALIIGGVSMEGIALDLDVSIHSAISYRRRACQKLGIATQKELFGLALRVQHG